MRIDGLAGDDDDDNDNDNNTNIHTNNNSGEMNASRYGRDVVVTVVA